jgi:hypothetical protein
VTAEDIGSEYNLPGGVNLSFADLSANLYSAYSPDGFSGGSSREIAVVSSKDQGELEEKLTEEFKQKAAEKISREAGEELRVFPEAVTLEVQERRFDHELGEETETISLSLVAKAQTLGFSPDSLKKLLVAESADRIPEEFELIPGQIGSQEEFLREAKGALMMKVNFQAHLLPKFDLVEIKRKIAGRKPSIAEEYLTGYPPVADAQITLWPPLPSFLWRLPHRTEKIDIEVKPE